MWQYGNGMGGWGLGLMTVGNLLVSSPSREPSPRFAASAQPVSRRRIDTAGRGPSALFACRLGMRGCALSEAGRRPCARR
jgi:hypothetical protein